MQIGKITQVNTNLQNTRRRNNGSTDIHRVEGSHRQYSMLQNKQYKSPDDEAKGVWRKVPRKNVK